MRAKWLVVLFIFGALFALAGAVLTNTSISGSAGRSVSYDYVSPTVTDVTTDGDRTWRLTRDSNGRLTGIRRPGSSTDDISISYVLNDVM